LQIIIVGHYWAPKKQCGGYRNHSLVAKVAGRKIKHKIKSWDLQYILLHIEESHLKTSQYKPAQTLSNENLKKWSLIDHKIYCNNLKWMTFSGLACIWDS
jgi:hypothetical protein